MGIACRFLRSHAELDSFAGDAMADADGDEDGFGNRTSLSNDARCRPVADWEELLNAVRLQKQHHQRRALP